MVQNPNTTAKRRFRDSQRKSCLKNANVQIGPSGHWLMVTTSDDKTAGCCLENLGIGFGAEEVFVQWAEEQKRINRKD